MDRTNELQAAQIVIGHPLDNQDLLWEALQAAGSPYNFSVGGRYLREGNKPLAAIGDAVLKLVLRAQGRDLDLRIGESKDRVRNLENNEHLAAICDKIGLTPCIVLNPARRGHVPASLKATAVEAVLGAVFKESGIDICESVMVRWGLSLNLPDTLFFSHVPQASEGTSRRVAPIGFRKGSLWTDDDMSYYLTWRQ